MNKEDKQELIDQLEAMEDAFDTLRDGTNNMIKILKNSPQPDVKEIAHLNGEGEGTEVRSNSALEREHGGSTSQYPSVDVKSTQDEPNDLYETHGQCPSCHGDEGKLFFSESRKEWHCMACKRWTKGEKFEFPEETLCEKDWIEKQLKGIELEWKEADKHDNDIAQQSKLMLQMFRTQFNKRLEDVQDRESVLGYDTGNCKRCGKERRIVEGMCRRCIKKVKYLNNKQRQDSLEYKISTLIGFFTYKRPLSDDTWEFIKELNKVIDEDVNQDGGEHGVN